MARKPSGNSTAASSPVTDDLRSIKGIGSVFSRRLHDAGIFTYGQLASLSPAELSEKVTRLSAKYIAGQDWAGQARKLVPKKKRFRHPQREIPKRTIRQHYENFTIEFLLDEKKIIRRTHLVHIQSGDADTWAGWEANQLIDFLARHTGVRISSKQLQNPKSSTISKQFPKNSSSSNTAEIKKVAPSYYLPNKLKTEQLDTTTTRPAFHSPAISNFTCNLHTQDLKVLLVDVDTRIYSLRRDQPFRVRLTLALTNVSIPNDISLKSKITINFKKLAGLNYLVSEEHNNINLSDRVTLDINCTSPPPGLYRPSAFVRLFSYDEAETGLVATTKGDLIQVF